MRINEKTLQFFANSKPVDKEGYLMKRGDGKKNLVLLSIAQKIVFTFLSDSVF